MRRQLALASLLACVRSAWAGAAAADVEHAVTLQRRGGAELGFSFSTEGEVRIIEKISPGGLLGAWNREHPGGEVRVGDGIVEVNGLRASAPGFVGTFRTSSELRMKLWRRAYSVVLDKSSGAQLGLQLSMDLQTVLVVTSINTGGLVEAWNVQHPEAQVQLGDEIVEINGVRGNAGALYKECTQNKPLRIKLYRQLIKSAPKGQYYFSEAATKTLEEIYWPNFAGLFLMEGSPMYPMPPSNKVPDLLQPLRGTKGIAVHTDPGITVSEGQGYAMLAAGMRKDVQTLMGLTVGWQAAGQGFVDRPACGGCGASCAGAAPNTCLCKTVPGAYMPGWSMPMDKNWKMGSATDADQDAVTGLIYLAELTDNEEIRRYAVRSITAFVLEDIGFANVSANSRRVPVVGDIPPKLQTIYLWRSGTCGGGYDMSSHDINHDLCISPGYFSPGQWRLFQRYLKAHQAHVPPPHQAQQLIDALESAIVWGYNTLQRIACPNGIVSNWWSLPTTGWPYNGKLQCSNSGTKAGAYYSDAARIPWRVVLDYLWFPDAKTPFYNEQGRLQGNFGAKEYANRWAGAWMQLIQQTASGNAAQLSEDGILGLLNKLPGCKTVPMGFTALVKNGWGSLPVVTTFQVPMEGMEACRGQQWLDYVAKIGLDQCVNNQYFDLGQEVIIGSILGGNAWLPVSTTAFLITLDKAGGMELGLDLEMRGSILFVKNIDGGLVQQWNARNPFWSVMVGDEIAAVNDIVIPSRQVVEIRTKQHLMIKLRRTEQTRASSCPHASAPPMDSGPVPSPPPPVTAASAAAQTTASPQSSSAASPSLASAGAAQRGGGAGGKCVAVNKQCGGKSWKGVTCCEPGCHCKKSSSYYSQCVPATGKTFCNESLPVGASATLKTSGPAPSPPPSSTAAPTAAQTTASPQSSTAAPAGASGKCVGVNKQCGGKSWNGVTCCEPGCHCKKSGSYYSQCVAAPGRTFCNESLPVEHILYDVRTPRQDFQPEPLRWVANVGASVAIASAALLAAVAYRGHRRNVRQLAAGYVPAGQTSPTHGRRGL